MPPSSPLDPLLLPEELPLLPLLLPLLEPLEPLELPLLLDPLPLVLPLPLLLPPLLPLLLPEDPPPLLPLPPDELPLLALPASSCALEAPQAATPMSSAETAARVPTRRRGTRTKLWTTWMAVRMTTLGDATTRFGQDSDVSRLLIAIRRTGSPHVRSGDRPRSHVIPRSDESPAPLDERYSQRVPRRASLGAPLRWPLAALTREVPATPLSPRTMGPARRSLSAAATMRRHEVRRDRPLCSA
jgi:hypothetical protein